jgi:hypothetical protein
VLQVGIGLWSEGRRAGCTTWENISSVVADKEASSAKTEVCDCKKKK